MMNLIISPSPKRFQSLYDEVWKQGNSFIRSHRGVNILEHAVSRLAYRNVILVRDEYSRIWEHILSRRDAAIIAGLMDQEGLVVTGPSGIGKSLFLYYALGAGLQARIPVVLCNNKDFCYIFDATGFKVFWFSHGDQFDVPDHTLYLVLCNANLHSPPSLFSDRSGVLVQTASLIHRTDWQWAERLDRALFWMMDVWTRTEMQALQRTMEALTHTSWASMAPRGKAVYTPLEIFDLLGPSARQCVRLAGMVKTRAGPKADWIEFCKSGRARVFSHINDVLSADGHRPLPPVFYEGDELDGTLVLYNACSNNPSRVPEFHYAVPTLFLRGILTDHLCSAFRPRTPPCIAAAVLARAPSLAATFYQPLLVEDLSETRAGRICNLVDDDNHGTITFRLGPGLALSHQAIDFKLDPKAPPLGIALEDECILVPCMGFTAFDAVVVSEGKTRVTMLRMAVGALELDEAAIRSAITVFDRVLPHPEDVRWSFVYAALDGDRARNLAESETARRKLVALDPRLRVGWLEVGATLKRSARALLDAFETGLGRGEETGDERPAKRCKYESSGSEMRPDSKPKGKGRQAAGPKGGQPKTEARSERPNTRSQQRTT